VDGAGRLHVGSAGTIVGGTGFAKNVSGDLSSTSVVSFYPSFSMDTAVSFTLTGRAGKLFRSVIEVAAGIDQWLGQIRDRHLADQSTPDGRDHGQARHLSVVPYSNRSEVKAQHVRALDHVFESGLTSVLSYRKLTPHQRSASDGVTDSPLAAA